MASERIALRVGDRELSISSPGRVIFPDAGITKLDVVQHYLAVAEGALRGAGDRPNVMVRWPEGIGGEHFYQKRAPASRPPWIEVVALRFPSGRSAEEIVPREPAALVWMVQMGCLELHPHPVRADDLDHPDELRVDLDPVPGVEWAQIRDGAKVVHETLADLELVGWSKTSGSRGVHVLVRLYRRWGFDEVRRAALAIAREVERRAPSIATSKWWKEERHGVFLDYNQNAKDRTVCSAYSVRPRPDARVSTPLFWEELEACDPADFTVRTVAARFASIGDPHRDIEQHPCSLEKVLELAARQEAEGASDAPWPPHYQKQEGEPPRVQPSRAKKPKATAHEGEAPAKSKGRRTPSKPLIEIGRAAKKADALAGLERWKARHADVVPHLEARDVLVDAMRGRYSTWTRVRVNLEHVPPELRPPQEPLDPDYAAPDPRTAGYLAHLAKDEDASGPER